MTYKRRYVLGGIMLFFAGLTTVLLSGVLTTIILAITVAYVVRPAYRFFINRGLPRWWASLVTTVLVFIGAVALFIPMGIILYLNRTQIVEILLGLPETMVVSAFGYRFVLELEIVTTLAVDWIRTIAFTIVGMAPLLVIKVALFAIIVFALLLGGTRARQAVLSVVPLSYRDVVHAYEERAQATLYAIYVLQASLAFITFIIAVPVFWLLGYETYASLAVVAGTLQFLPIVGPSVLIAILIVYELLLGDIVGAVLVGTIGFGLIAAFPDLIIRPRIAWETASLPSAMYFVGFVGGLISMGPIGIIVGPLIVALLSESVTLLATELRGLDQSTLTELPTQ